MGVKQLAPRTAELLDMGPNELPQAGYLKRDRYALDAAGSISYPPTAMLDTDILPRSVLRRAVCALALMGILGGPPAPAVGQAPAEPFSSPSSVLVLRNGQVIRGSITRVGDFYRLTLRRGQMQFRAEEVEFACRDLQEAYLRKRAALPVGDVQQRLQLAEWCLSQDLLGPASAELGEVYRVSPRHPGIDLLRRRLELAVTPTVIHSAPQPEGNPATAKAPAVPPPSAENLMHSARELPPGTVESFTRRIQPILTNHCSAMACHGYSTKSEFQLIRVAQGATPSPLITQRNLHSVLKWVDRRSPQSSQLLLEPSKPHGGMAEPVFARHEAAQYRQLAEWVSQLAERPPADAHASLPEVVERTPPVAEEPSAFDPIQPAKIPEVAGYRPQYGAAPRRFVPADPFDPEIFNRRYFAAPTEPAIPSAAPSEPVSPAAGFFPTGPTPGTGGYSGAVPATGPFPRPSASGPTRLRPGWPAERLPSVVPRATMPIGPSSR